MQFITVNTIFLFLILVQIAVKTNSENGENNRNRDIEEQLVEENEKLKLENQRMLSFLSVAEQQNVRYNRTKSGFEVAPNCNLQGMCESKENRELMIKCEDTEYIRFCLETCRSSYVQCTQVSLVAFDNGRTARYERRIKELSTSLTDCELAASSGLPLPKNCKKDDWKYVPPKKVKKRPKKSISRKKKQGKAIEIEEG